MRLREFALLADENIHPDVVAALRAAGCDVLGVRDGELAGSADTVILQRAYSDNRVVVTHDKDFGALSIARLQPLVGVVFLRPGHIDPQFTLETLRLLFATDPEVASPFILVAKHTANAVTIRVRNL